MAHTRQLAVIMFTDIIGYTIMMEKNEQQTVKLLRRNRSIHSKLVSSYNGKMLKEMGDGILAKFNTVSDAVFCAGAIMEEIKDDENLRLRIGIHLGEVYVEGDDLYGDGVNIANRIEAIASEGQILVSESVHKNIKNIEGVTSEFKGEKQLKNISDPVKVYEVKVQDFEYRTSKSFKNRNMQFMIIGAVLALVIITLLILFLKKDDQDEMKPTIMQPLTYSSALVQYPDQSPDGSILIYCKFTGESIDIMYRSRGSTIEKNITDSPYDEYSPCFSPDGQKISFWKLLEDGVDLYVMSSSGENPKKLASSGLHVLEQVGEVFFGLSSNPWSSTGERILFPRLNESGGTAIWAVNVNTGRMEQITFPDPGVIDISASYNDDGSEIVFMRDFKVWLKDNEGVESPLLNEKNASYLNPVFDQNNNIIFSFAYLGQPVNLWRYSRQDETTTQLTSTVDVSFYPNPTNQNSLLFIEFNHQTDLTLYDLNTGELKQLTDHIGNNFHPAVSPYGNKVVYQSDRTGNSEIWLYKIDSETEVQLTSSSSNDIVPAWSPDGLRVAFLSNRSGNPEDYAIWVTDTTGIPPKKITTQPIELASYYYDYAMEMKWSSDGKRIGFIAKSKGGRTLWSVRPDGLEQNILIQDIHSFDWYIDGNTVIYNKISRSPSDRPGLRVRNLETGEDSLFFSSRATEIFVSPDGKRIGYAYDLSHVNQSLYLLDTLADFPFSAEHSDQITDGNGLWHAHMADWFPHSRSIIFVKDTDWGIAYELIHE